jgi:hypothetical protein
MMFGFLLTNRGNNYFLSPKSGKKKVTGIQHLGVDWFSLSESQ